MAEDRQTYNVAQEVVRERLRQDAKWGGRDHDDRHTLPEWCNFISERVVKLRQFDDGSGADEGPETRSLLIEIAALAVATVESYDRRYDASRVCVKCENHELHTEHLYRPRSKRDASENPCGWAFPLPGWAGEDQMDPCRCDLAAGHQVDHSCEHLRESSTGGDGGPPVCFTDAPPHQQGEDA